MKLFTEKQLSLVEQCAISCAERKSGELSVHRAVKRANRVERLFTKAELYIIWFCAEECRRQNEPEPEMCVYHYVTAYDLFYTYSLESQYPTLEQRYEVACLIEPQRNNGYRRVAVRFRNGSQALDPEKVERALESLFNRGGLQALSPQEAYVEFEDIHPCTNGNGRYGKLLYNGLRGTLLKPEFPKEPARFAQGQVWWRVWMRFLRDSVDSIRCKVAMM
jgi:hypothetical protein